MSINFQDEPSTLDQLRKQLSNLPSDTDNSWDSGANWLSDLGFGNSHLPTFEAFHFDVFDEYAIAGRGGVPGPGDGGGGGGKGNGGGGDGGGGDPNLLTSYVSGDANVDDAMEFNLGVNFLGDWTVEQQAMVTWVADFFSQLITADVRDDTDLQGNFVDDITIDVSSARIDGKGNPLFGNILAEAEIIAVRDPADGDGAYLPVTSRVTLDTTDLNRDDLAPVWPGIIMHEFAHALGFAGGIFEALGLVDGDGNFIGANATLAYGGPVPIESDGGSGTAGSHWDELTFQQAGWSDVDLDGDKKVDITASQELMTGFVGAGAIYLSDTTVQAFADLGYTVQDPSPGSGYLVIDGNMVLA